MEVGADLWKDTGVLSFWSPRRMCVFDVSIVDMNEDTYVGTQPLKVLKQHDRRKKGKYLEACLE